MAEESTDRSACGGDRRWRIALFVWAIAVAAFASVVRPHVMGGLINDEAVELLQALDLPTDHAYYFAPPYRGGAVDLIEAVPSYANRAVWAFSRVGLRSVLLFHAVCLGVAVWVFGRAVGRHRGPAWGLVAAVLFGGSSYVVFYDQLATRNALTPLWGAFIVGAASALVASDGLFGPAWLLAPVLALAMASYTSFKVLVLPLCLALALASALARRWRAAGMAVAVFALTMALTALAVSWTRTRPQALLHRGEYAIGRTVWHRYPAHLWRTYALPVFRDAEYQDFMVEETNVGYARAMLPLVLAPFFVLGLAAATVARRSADETWPAATFVLAVPAFALGGPSLKHCLALFPFVVLLAVDGLRRAHGWSRRLAGRSAAAALVLGVVAAALAAEQWHLLHEVPSGRLLQFMNGVASATAETIIRDAPERPVVLLDALGVDVVRWRRREAAGGRTDPAPVYWFRDEEGQAALRDVLLHEPRPTIVMQGNRVSRFLLNESLADDYQRSVSPSGPFTVTLFRPREGPRGAAPTTTP